MQIGDSISDLHRSRNAEKKLKQLARLFPVVTVTGPRQSGKTTLVKMCFPNKKYLSLEEPNIREQAIIDPLGFLNKMPDGGIIDEIQRVPILFSFIQTIVDENKRNNMFILTGSNQFEFMHNLGQSLAGRTGILKLLPFSYPEIFKDKFIPLTSVLFTGFFPRIYDQNIPESDFYAGFINTYLERDVRLLSNIRNLAQFQRFLVICASRTGRIINKENISNEAGISAKTVEDWLSILEASFLIYRLQPYFKNIKKRIIKSPKLYFLDVGLVSYLLGIQNFKQLTAHPLRGELFETFVVTEFLKILYHAGKRSNLYFYRDSNGSEIDLILDTAFGPVPVEIKANETFNSFQLTNLKKYRRQGFKYIKDGLILNCKYFDELSETLICGYHQIERFFNKLMDDGNFEI